MPEQSKESTHNVAIREHFTNLPGKHSGNMPTARKILQSNSPRPLVVDGGSVSISAKAKEIHQRHTLGRAEDIFAAHNEVQRCCFVINEAEQICKPHNIIAWARSAVHEVTQALKAEFEKIRLEFAEQCKETHLPTKAELMARFEILSIMLERDILPETISIYGTAEQDRAVESWKSNRDQRHIKTNKEEYSMTLHVCNGALSDSDSEEDVGNIIDSAARLSRVFNNITSNLSDHARTVLFGLPPLGNITPDQKESLFVYPAIHLAVKYGSPETIRKVVAKSGNRYFTETGLLNLSALQLAAYTRQLHKLQTTFEKTTGVIVAWCDNDIFSLTPHLIAAYHNDEATFKLLHAHNGNMDACDIWGRSARVLCAQWNSKEVMKFILLNNISMFSPHSDLCTAIRTGNRNMAKRLAKHYAKDAQFRTDFPQFYEEAKQLATEFSWQDVLDALASEVQSQNVIQFQNEGNVRAAISGAETLSWDENMDYAGTVPGSSQDSTIFDTQTSFETSNTFDFGFMPRQNVFMNSFYQDFATSTHDDD